LAAEAIEMPLGIWRKYRHIVENMHPSIRFIWYLLANHFGAFEVRRMLKKNNVLSARYIHSTKAHHIVYGCPIARLIPLRFITTLQPDLVYYLTVSQTERERRISNRKNNTVKDKDSKALFEVDRVFRTLHGLIEIDTTHLNEEDVAEIIFQDIKKRTSREP
jgi:thymidylate kinase